MVSFLNQILNKLCTEYVDHIYMTELLVDSLTSPTYIAWPAGCTFESCTSFPILKYPINSVQIISLNKIDSLFDRQTWGRREIRHWRMLMVMGLRLFTLVFIRLNPTSIFCNINDCVVSRKPRILQKYDIPTTHCTCWGLVAKFDYVHKHGKIN